MTTEDYLSSALADYVRGLPDDVLLELLTVYLQAKRSGAGAPASPRMWPAPPPRLSRAAAAQPPSPPSQPTPARRPQRRKQVTTDHELLAEVERVVRGSNGLGLSEIAQALMEPDKVRVAAALRTLRAEGRVANGGTRRYTRWAADKATAEAAAAQR